MTELGKLMLLNVPHPISPETETWKGEYYSACKVFVQENAGEIAEAGLDVDKLLKAQGLIYWSGDKLWKRAIDAKREL